MHKRKYVLDLGTTNVSLYGAGLLLRQPDVAVVRRGNGIELVCAGNDAIALGELPEGCSFIRPVEGGTVVHADVTGKMLSHYFDSLIPRNILSPVELYVLIPVGISITERENVEYAVTRTGFKDVTLIESVFGLLPFLPSGDSAVVILGGGSTEVGVLNEKGIINACSVNLAGDVLDEKIADAVSETYNLHISLTMARKLKESIGSLFKNDASVADVTGRDELDGRLKTIEVSAESIRKPIVECYRRIAELIESVLTGVPYAGLADIAENGLFVAGGGAGIRGLTDYLGKYLKIPVHIIEDPETAVIRGASALIADESGKYASILSHIR